MDDLNVVVFTTQNVGLNKKTIMLVFHDKDGDWQFFADGDTSSSKTAMLLSLGEILDKDLSIKELADLPLGYKAYRKEKSSQWVRESYSDEE